MLQRSTAEVVGDSDVEGAATAGHDVDGEGGVLWHGGRIGVEGEKGKSKCNDKSKCQSGSFAALRMTAFVEIW